MHLRKARTLSLCLILVAFVVVLPAAAKDAQPSEPRGTATAAVEQPAAASASRCQRCGDGYCARSCENELTCPADCAPQTRVNAACGKCGDGRCVPQCGETAESCPADCGYSRSARAGDAKASEAKASDCEAEPRAGKKKN